jgi:hypothetical protein
VPRQAQDYFQTAAASQCLGSCLQVQAAQLRCCCAWQQTAPLICVVNSRCSHAYSHCIWLVAALSCSC